MSKGGTHTSFDESQVKVELLRPPVKLSLVAPLVFVLHVLEEGGRLFL